MLAAKGAKCSHIAIGLQFLQTLDPTCHFRAVPCELQDQWETCVDAFKNGPVQDAQAVGFHRNHVPDERKLFYTTNETFTHTTCGTWRTALSIRHTAQCLHEKTETLNPNTADVHLPEDTESERFFKITRYSPINLIKSCCYKYEGHFEIFHVPLAFRQWERQKILLLVKWRGTTELVQKEKKSVSCVQKRRQDRFRTGLWSKAGVYCTHLINQLTTAPSRKTITLPRNVRESDPTNSSSNRYPLWHSLSWASVVTIPNFILKETLYGSR